jgi:hypothetical protein
VSAWVYVASITAAAISNRGLGIWDNFTDLYSTLDTSHAVGRWVKHTVSLAVNAGATFLEIRLYGPQGTVYWDAIQIEQASSASIYTDGDQPGATWSGTAHGSTSSRAANPSFDLFTGELRSISGVRRHMTLQATGRMETYWRRKISAGPFSRKPADDILRRLIDILEGEKLNDPAFRFGGDAWIAVGGGGETTSQLSAAIGGAADPDEWYSIEGDNVREVANITGLTQGTILEMITGYGMTTGVAYRVGLFIGTRTAGAVGKQLTLNATETGSAGISVTGVLPAVGDLLYLELTVTFTNGAATTRKIQVFTSTSDWTTGGPFTFFIDGVHVIEAVNTIDHETRGDNWAAEIEYLDAFHRSAGATLEELADSVGAWVYENGSGALVFEDFSTRDPANASFNRPLVRFSDTPDDGFGYDLTEYEEPATSLAGTVKVGSFGDVSKFPGPATTAKQVWSLEPVPVALGANERRIFYADYVSEGDAEQSSLIARIGGARALPISGYATDFGINTPYLLNYGRSGEIVVKKNATPANLEALLVGARVQHRQSSERVFVTVGSDEPTLELETPAQGERTALMTALATWALAKYDVGPASLRAVHEAAADAGSLLEVIGRDVGVPYWVRHTLGAGALAIDALFYAEGWKIAQRTGGAPELTLRLEEA